ncbi:hypothetical protein CK203_048325 [Vitis vinifera]|uniref:HMG box domain-containing protein n=1 Tax=Vitis vinifera TaxID=29760 RepID=A0A438HRK2_VITVI|nr:hypothetical protein CK203_048325 [Vitis vinifera]
MVGYVSCSSPPWLAVSHALISTPLHRSMVGCPWLAVSRALISTLLHRQPSCPPYRVSVSPFFTEFRYFPLSPYSALLQVRYCNCFRGHLFESERNVVEVVRNPKRPIGAWIHYYNDQLAMIKEKDKGVKINDDLRKKLGKKWNELSKVEKEDFMAKSKESSKQYSLQKGVVPKLYLQTRCSPERVIRVIEELEPKQRAAIEEIGRLPLVMLENQIREDKEGGNDFKVRFVLFVLGALLCPTMKLFVKRSFLHLVEDIDSIKKMNWAEFVLSYLVHGIEEFKMKQQSGVCGCLLFLMLFYHEHISFEEKFLPLYTRPCPRITAWGDDEVLDMKRRLKKVGGYANDNVKIWVIQNEIRDCVDRNVMTMERENERSRNLKSIQIKMLLNEYVLQYSSCEKVLTEFEEKYTTLKGLFLGSSGKPLRMHEEGTKNDILSCERSLEDKDNKNGNEHYVRTLSIEKLCTEDLNGKNEDACATSIEVHIIPDENVDILPLPIKRSRRDYGKEPLRALCGYPDHVMKTRTSRERKPSKFKVSPFVHNLRKMGKRQASESIPMSIREDVVDGQSFNVLQSLVADYVFNKALSKSELLVDFDHEHGVRGDFECLRLDKI